MTTSPREDAERPLMPLPPASVGKGRLMSMKRRWFTWHMNAYRLIVGAIVLAIVLPARAVSMQAMWLVALACILVVTCAVVAGTRVPVIREWLRH